jgi:hypothetical protein
VESRRRIGVTVEVIPGTWKVVANEDFQQKSCASVSPAGLALPGEKGNRTVMTITIQNDGENPSGASPFI